MGAHVQGGFRVSGTCPAPPDPLVRGAAVHPLKLKRLSKGGTLISIGVDMELAQALGAGDSSLPINEPEYKFMLRQLKKSSNILFDHVIHM